MNENLTPLQWLLALAEYLGGQRDEAPRGFPLSLRSPLWAFWWAFLTVLILLFSGQSSKFIYVDF